MTGPTIDTIDNAIKLAEHALKAGAPETRTNGCIIYPVEGGYTYQFTNDLRYAFTEYDVKCQARITYLENDERAFDEWITPNAQTTFDDIAIDDPFHSPILRALLDMHFEDDDNETS